MEFIFAAKRKTAGSFSFGFQPAQKTIFTAPSRKQVYSTFQILEDTSSFKVGHSDGRENSKTPPLSRRSSQQYPKVGGFSR